VTTRTFTDAGCTHEIVAVTRGAMCTTAALPGYAVRVTGSTCSPDITASALLQLGAASSHDIVYVLDDAGTCSSQPTSGGTFVDVVAEVDPGTLGRITEIVE
jgi:hypothetical protein